MKEDKAQAPVQLLALKCLWVFPKGQLRSETFDNTPKKLQQLGTFMKVPNMNHCAADARRAFPVLLREPLGLEQAWRPEGG